GNPWGSWKDLFLEQLSGGTDLDVGEIYFSTALRCSLEEVSQAELRRCSRYLAEELYLVGPRLVLVSGKLAAVTLRAALGDEVPGKPRAGDSCRLFSSDFVFDLDVARIGSDSEASRIFWNVLSKPMDALRRRS
ncbi:MAG: hypothetical protein ACOC78_01915, partial [Actinomycetota bacterium]